MATFLAPLYKLLEKNRKWEWKKDEERAFQEAKRTIGSSSLLVHFDNNKEVVLACDASPYGLGAVISHKTAEGDRPIAFASRSLTKAEKNYSHLEKEALALVFGVTRFRNYLLGRSFTLLTDHRTAAEYTLRKQAGATSSCSSHPALGANALCICLQDSIPQG
ncbi:hypothetical protein JTE90_025442 [Oedothorax gibbosus]|uniref:Reverse transcriptase/retrotransposon-derived protein RNase H-like domain-containing protein n=1 Tax=Oedothorax gibbosus TaxID=931172 RepID=A0AAV6U8L2_9ARAC|nr:hypothetical protein JTE90_025442 [Oedothorax gibbosus]